MFALNPDLKLRRAGIEDAVAVHTLMRQAFEIYVSRMGREPSPMYENYEEVLVRDMGWVVESPDRLAAAMVLQLNETSLVVDLLGVNPEFQGRKIGAALMALADEEARKLDRFRVNLYTHETMVENLSIYERLGYGVTHKKNEVIYMEKILEQALAA